MLNAAIKDKEHKKELSYGYIKPRVSRLVIISHLTLKMDMLMSYIMMLKVNVCILGAMAYNSVFITL